MMRFVAGMLMAFSLLAAGCGDPAPVSAER